MVSLAECGEPLDYMEKVRIFAGGSSETGESLKDPKTKWREATKSPESAKRSLKECSETFKRLSKGFQSLRKPMK